MLDCTFDLTVSSYTSDNKKLSENKKFLISDINIT